MVRFFEPDVRCITKEDAKEMGPMLPSKGGTKFIIVIVDYFTKWVEAEEMAIVMVQRVTKFL